MRYSIPTRYNGTLFRSKLEADWARALEDFGFTWRYESEGFYFGDTFYCPDFYLDEYGLWLEVKAVWNDRDLAKAEAFCRGITAHRPEDIPVLLWGGPGGKMRHFQIDRTGEFALCSADGCGPCSGITNDPDIRRVWGGRK